MVAIPYLVATSNENISSGNQVAVTTARANASYIVILSVEFSQLALRWSFFTLERIIENRFQPFILLSQRAFLAKIVFAKWHKQFNIEANIL